MAAALAVFFTAATRSAAASAAAEAAGGRSFRVLRFGDALRCGDEADFVDGARLAFLGDDDRLLRRGDFGGNATTSHNSFFRISHIPVMSCGLSLSRSFLTVHPVRLRAGHCSVPMQCSGRGASDIALYILYSHENVSFTGLCWQLWGGADLTRRRSRPKRPVELRRTL